MKRAGIVLALLIIAVGAWVDWTYHAIRTEISEIGAGLPVGRATERDVARPARRHQV